MGHYGLICPPGTSHVTGLTTIARELCRRGHRATVFNIPDVESLAGREGVGFHPLGARDHPKGSFEAFSKQLSSMKGLAALRFGMRVALEEIAMLLEEAPDALRSAGVTALLVDQGQPAGSTLAERVGVPFVTVCNAVPVDPDPEVPPSIVGWGPARSGFDRLKNRAAWRLFDVAAAPIRRKINSYRRAWGSRLLPSLYDTFSPVLEVAQLTEDFDFPRSSRSSHFHYIGLIRRTASSDTPFPFERLDGRPLVYGSLGTVTSDTRGVFRALAEACAALDLQLVLTMGGNRDAALSAGFPGEPIVVSYAPQLAILERAAVTVSPGTNTVLESLASGVPVISIPMYADQFGVASRLERSGAGARIPSSGFNTARLRDLLRRITSEPSFTARARVLSASLERAGGERRAADLIEQALGEA